MLLSVCPQLETSSWLNLWCVSFLLCPSFPAQTACPQRMSWDAERKPNLTTTVHMTAQQTLLFRNKYHYSNACFTVHVHPVYWVFFFFKEFCQEKDIFFTSVWVVEQESSFCLPILRLRHFPWIRNKNNVTLCFGCTASVSGNCSGKSQHREKT